MVHLVYCDNAGKRGEKVLDKILAGTKTMIVRGAAGRKIPHSRVFEGERLYFMEKGSGEVTATALVKEVKNFVKLSDEEITKILAENQSISKKYDGIKNAYVSWNLKMSKKYLPLLLNIREIWMIGLF